MIYLDSAGDELFKAAGCQGGNDARYGYHVKPRQRSVQRGNARCG